MFHSLIFVFFSAVLFFENEAFSHISGRIIGGNPAHINQFPFVAAIDAVGPGVTWFCGGTLYRSQWIITVAQCADKADRFTIRLGAASLTSPDSNRQTLSASLYFLHPEYNSATLENDIGLIKLRMPVVYTDYIKPVNYLAIAEVWPNTRVAAVGWGQINDVESSLSDSLQLTYVTTLTNEECQITFGNQVTDEMVCVDGNYNEGACHGDTGSPLILLHPRDYAELVGISSFVSYNGCESTDPSGYTRIYPYVDWINNVTSSN